MAADLPVSMHRSPSRRLVSAVSLRRPFARIFYRNAINIGLPIIECPEAVKNIEAGDTVEVNFDTGMIYNRTKGTEYKGQAFPSVYAEDHCCTGACKLYQPEISTG